MSHRTRLLESFPHSAIAADSYSLDSRERFASLRFELVPGPKGLARL